MMAYKNEFIVPTHHRWLERLNMFLYTFFVKETRTNIRIHAVSQTMNSVYQLNRLVDCILLLWRYQNNFSFIIYFFVHYFFMFSY